MLYHILCYITCYITRYITVAELKDFIQDSLAGKCCITLTLMCVKMIPTCTSALV